MLSITETVNLEYIQSAKAYKNGHNKRTSFFFFKVWRKACLNCKENSKRWMSGRRKFLDERPMTKEKLSTKQ